MSAVKVLSAYCTAMITSTHNPKIQWIRKLQTQVKSRRQDSCFAVEGVRLVEEALQVEWETKLVLYSGGLSQRGMDLAHEFIARGVSVEEVSPHVMEAMAETDSPQGLLAVLALKNLPLPATPNFLLIADGVRDPGNLGTVLRTAAAAGVQTVLLTPGSTDAFAPKVVRAAMGAHFRLPIHALDWEQIATILMPPAPAKPFMIYLADARGEMAYTQADFRQPTVLIIGGEAAGASKQATLLADQRLRIPMSGGMESLNAAAAAAILMFEVVRQRR